MKLILAIAAVAFVTPAAAADLPAKAPPVAAPMFYNWSGFYAGVNAGGGMASASFFDVDCFTCADTKFQTPFGTVGGQVGYNWQWGSTVLGVEGDLNWLSAKESHGFAIDDFGMEGTASFKFDAFGSIRGRVGLAYDRTLFYVTAGPAWGHFNSVTTLGNLSTPPSTRDINTDNAWHVGLAAGAGVEYMLAPHWSLRGEYLFLDFPDVLANFVPYPPNGLPRDANFRMNYGYTAHVARLGLNYRFGGDPAVLPAAATSSGKNAYKALALAAPTANWAGFYLGVNGGGGITDADFLDTACLHCGATNIKTGFGTAGGQIGYNWQWGSTVLGLESDLNWVSAKDSRGLSLDHNSFEGTANLKFDAFGSIRARAGLAFDRTLAYVTAGPVWGHFNSLITLGDQAQPPRLRDTATDDAWHIGLAAGAGVEFMLDPYWSLRGEYMYLDFRDAVANFVPVPPIGRTADALTQTTFAYSAHLARVGLNYKVGGTGNATPARISPPANWKGFYIGANAGAGVAKSDSLDDCFSCDDVAYHKGFGTVGGQLGYNWQWTSLVLGVEGDLNWTSVNGTQTVDQLNNCCGGTTTFKMDGFGSVRGRAGLAFDRTLAYVTAGPAWGHFNSSWLTTQTVQYLAPDDGWRFGVAAGAGIEFMLAPNWSLRGEFLNLTFDDRRSSCQPINSAAVNDRAGTLCHITFASSAQIGRIGLNYIFQ